MPLSKTLTSAPTTRLERKMARTGPAEAELMWFFNEAESEIDLPSNFGAIAGISPSSDQAVEQRTEAMHTAGKINLRLRTLPPGHVAVLAGRYKESVWPRAVVRELGHLAGVVEALPEVRAQYLRALIAGKTRTRSVAAWLEELIEQGGPGAVDRWHRDAEAKCAAALAAYDALRDSGPTNLTEEG